MIVRLAVFPAPGDWIKIVQGALVNTLTTAVLGLALIGATGLRGMAKDPKVKRRSMAAGIAIEVAISAGLVPLMKSRVRGVD